MQGQLLPVAWDFAQRQTPSYHHRRGVDSRGGQGSPYERRAERHRYSGFSFCFSLFISFVLTFHSVTKVGLPKELKMERLQFANNHSHKTFLCARNKIRDAQLEYW